MKLLKTRSFYVIIVLLLTISFSFLLFPQDNDIVATVTKVVNGAVFYKCEEQTDDEWERARVGNVIYENCFINTTTDTLASLQFTPELEIELLGDTEIYVGTISAEVVEITLKSGSLVSDLEKIRTQLQEYKINSISSTAGIRGTKFLMTTDFDKNTVLVKSGGVNVTSNFNKNIITQVNKGMAVKVPSLGNPSSPIKYPEQINNIFEDENWTPDEYMQWEDEWDDWDDDAWDDFEDTWDSEYFDNDDFEEFFDDMLEEGIWDDDEWGDDWEDAFYDDEWDDDDWDDDDWTDEDWGDEDWINNDWTDDDWTDDNWTDDDYDNDYGNDYGNDNDWGD